METLQCTKLDSVIGPLFLAASTCGLVALEFDARLPGQQSIRPNRHHLRKEKEQKGFKFEDSPRHLQAYVSELEEYFAGKRREFTFPLDLRGTDFQRACWRALLKIPYGETRTYADIARAVGKPNAFRAVGMANNRNPVAIVVPCHRVIASNGTLCGYGGGLDVKRRLLGLEGALSGTLAA
jgi:O-6-methylguanine DNA methyltransferase